MSIVKIEQFNAQIEALEEKRAMLQEENEERQYYIDRWNQEHMIRNLLSRFAYYYSAGQYMRCASMFTDTDQGYLQISDVGIYEGKEAINGYFSQLEKNAVEGSFRMMPLTSEILELADDMESAQAMYFINGISAIKDPSDPAKPAGDIWINDKFAAELVKEDGQWVILRLNINDTMRAAYHKSWGDYAAAPEYPSFDTFPQPSRPATRYMPFSPERNSQKNLTTPEPYGTFEDIADHN